MWKQGQGGRRVYFEQLYKRTSRLPRGKFVFSNWITDNLHIPSDSSVNWAALY